MDKKLRIKLIVFVSVFAAVFTALALVASFYDLEISKALTKGSLEAGKYHATGGFGLFFEVFGFSTFYLSGALGGIICTVCALKMRDGDAFFFIKQLKGKAYIAVKWIIAAGFFAFAVYEMYCVVHESLKYAEKYLKEAIYGTGAEFTLESGYLIAVQVVYALILSVMTAALISRLNRENALRLLKVALILLLVELMYLAVIESIKQPIGRMRYRTMNALGDFSHYTPWYKINGARNVSVDGEIIYGSIDKSQLFLGVSDTCKSFPSGHTYGAAMSFALVCLPDLFEKFKKTYVKAICWTVPAVYTVTVAVSRIMVGAHFFSDVLFGGSLAFALVMILREAVILNSAHIKAFIKKKPIPEAEEE